VSENDTSVSTVAERLRLDGGFAADEREKIVDRMGTLDRRLATFDIDGVDLELSVKERDTPSQKVVLECWIAGWPRTVATSTRANLGDAISEVRDDLVRQLNSLKTRKEPKNNRNGRAT